MNIAIPSRGVLLLVCLPFNGVLSDREIASTRIVLISVNKAQLNNIVVCCAIEHRSASFVMFSSSCYLARIPVAALQ